LLISLISFFTFSSPSILLLWQRWTEDESYYVHGPVAMLGFVWLASKELRLIFFRQWALTLSKYIAIIFFLIATIYFQIQRLHLGEYLGLTAILAIWIWGVWGWETLKRLRWAFWFLLLSIPIPSFCLVHISFFLRQLSVSIVVAILKMLPMSVEQDGNLINFGAHWVRVADACSGLRTLITVIAACSLLAYFEQDFKKRLMFFLLAFPMAIFSNVLRILIVCLGIGLGQGELFLGTLHEIIGWFSLALVWILSSFLVGKIPEQNDSNKKVDCLVSQLEPGLSKRMRDSVLMSILFLGSFGFVSQSRVEASLNVESTVEDFARVPSQTSLLPVGSISHLGPWQGEELEISEVEYRILGSRNLRYREFERVGFESKLYFFELNSALNQSVTHPPEISLVSEGYETQVTESVLLHGQKKSWQGRRTVYTGVNNGLLVYHWYIINEYATDSYLDSQFRSLLALLGGKTIQTAMKRVSIELPQEEFQIKDFDREVLSFIGNL
jgi:exosortase